MIEFRVLGPLEIAAEGRILRLGGRKQRALLALLLLHSNEVVSADRLVNELWGERPPDTVQTMIQVYVSRVRKALGPERIATRPPGYRPARPPASSARRPGRDGCDTARGHGVSENLRTRLAGEGPPLVATFVIVPRVEIVELAALAGFDAVILDQEHGPIGVETLPPLVAAARGAGLACLVRVPEGRAKQIEAALDVGADGVLVPHVSSAAAAADAVAGARFAPEGRRGANPYVRAADYSANARFFAEANERAACLALVEGKQGVEAIDEILAVPGLDAVFIGPVDLSAALGVTGQPEHPIVVETVRGLVENVRGLVEKGRGRGVATAVFAPTSEAARRWLSLGVRLVALSVDTGLILEGFRAALAQVR